MKTLLVIIVILNTCMAFGQNRLFIEDESSRDFEQLLTRISNGNYNLWKSSFAAAGAVDRDMISGGLNSTIKFGVSINNYAKNTSVDESISISKKEVEILLQMIKNSHFSGDMLENLYTLVFKLQKHYNKLK